MNKNFKALEDLQEATKKAEISANEFRLQYEKIFPKRSLKEARFKKKVEELEIYFVENLYDEGTICGGCWEKRNTCEGSNCGNRMDEYFGDIKRDELSRKYFELYGDKFYNFSRRLKNELLKK